MNKAYRAVKWKGEEFPTVEAFTKVSGFSRWVTRYKIYNQVPIDGAVAEFVGDKAHDAKYRNRKRTYVYRGEPYRSFREIAEVVGVTVQAVHRQFKQGRPLRGYIIEERQALTFRGQQWGSLDEIAQHVNLPLETVIQRFKEDDCIGGDYIDFVL